MCVCNEKSSVGQLWPSDDDGDNHNDYDDDDKGDVDDDATQSNSQSPYSYHLSNPYL